MEFITYQRKCKICMKTIQHNRYLITHCQKIEKPVKIKNPVGRPRKIINIEPII
jgi:hypothetical protein